MAIDMMISEASSLVTSPRISFSDDLSNEDATDQEFPFDIDSSNSEFDFCISNNTNTETCSADELFLDGLIRPLRLQEKFVTCVKQQLPSSKTQTSAPNQEILKQQVTTTTTTIVVEQKINQNKSFWHIKRSTSLHCVKKSSFWSLSRSNSTGSVPNSKQSTKKQNAQFSKSPSANFYTSQKPPLRKNYYGGPNGVRINPVLNVPPPTFISKGTANLFGLASFFDKKSKK